MSGNEPGGCKRSDPNSDHRCFAMSLDGTKLASPSREQISAFEGKADIAQA
jgi:hypothetical protein